LHRESGKVADVTLFYWRGGSADAGVGASWATYDAGGVLVAAAVAPGTADSTFVESGGTLLGSLAAATINIDSATTIDAATSAPYTLIGNVGAGSVTVQDGTWDASGGPLVLGWAAAGALTVASGGSLAAASLIVGWQAAGTVTVAGGTLADAAGIDLGGTSDSIGLLLIQAGGSVATTAGNDTVGDAVGAQGTVAVGGTGASWSVSGTLAIGANGGTGAVTISAGGVVQAGAGVDLGNGADAGGTVTVLSGGSFDTPQELHVGAYGGGTGLLSVAGGTVTVGAEVSIGYQGAGTLAVTAAGTLTNGGTFTNIGDAGGTGAATIDGAGSTWSVNVFTVGAGGTGTLTIGNGGLMKVDDAGGMYASIGYSQIGGATGDGAVTITGTGSEMRVNGAIGVGFDNGTGTLDVLSGGLLDFTAPEIFDFDSLVIGNSVTGTGVVRVDGGTIQAGSNDILVGNEGAGSLDIAAGGSVDASGGLAVAVGTASTGTLTVEGATSLLTVEQNFVIGGAYVVGGPGLVSATGGGTIRSSASLTLYGGGTLAVDSTATVVIGSGTAGVAGAVLVDAGGSLLGYGTVASPLVLDGTAVAVGGTLEILGAVSGSATLTILGDATLKLDAAGDAAGVLFATAGSGTLDLATATGGVTISGFAAGSTIRVADAVGASASASVAGGVTTLDLFSGATEIGRLAIAGSEQFAFDSATGTVSVACFAAGTRIGTARGNVPVEHLALGDRVRMARRNGGTRPVVWLGHRVVNCRRHPDPGAVWPVRVRRNAFGRGRPARDLILSPDHAVFVGGVLIPIRHLLTGGSILQERRASVTYWHVELDRHDVLRAEGLPCESFLDTGNRPAFANGGTAIHLFADFTARVWDAESCAALTVAGPALDAARMRVAASLDQRLTGSPSRAR
jgi:T5SS/PEP-CTERM-associated repeat protein